MTPGTESAFSAVDLFPDLDGASKLYRRLARLVHPDRHKNSGRSKRAFIRLNELYAERTGAASRNKRIGDWAIHGGLARGSICDVHVASGHDEEAVLKVVRKPSDNGLLSQEATVLKVLHSDKVPESFHRYLPRRLDSMLVGGRRANVLTRATECFTLEHIFKAFPLGLPFEHIVWMGNRIWEILGAVHRANVIHGAVLPHHLMFRPGDHGLVLIDWSCSVSGGAHIPIVHKRWATHYPAEVRRKAPTFSTDIYMAGAALRYAATTVPRRFRAIFDWLMAASPASRPSDAWAVQDRWRSAAEDEFGKPKFVELRLPTN